MGICLIFTMETNTLYRVAPGRVVTEEKKLCRDPERCPGMQLNNRHRRHASTTTITSSESSGGGSKIGKGGGEI
ncbi:Hypothetical protein SMAX5B_009830 [Scophthalmus maximus]|uniref:Uncharacterized protein n=1 Tax=Scophthalmus maximus TaxID=52904 RepID=A0A2U9BVZ7_SCOMX|nr:Hypothetical protein SMAX5B_009830 [Scophthalmus maximus]